MSHSETAERLVLGDRNADYGSPKSDFDGTALGWTALLRNKLNPDTMLTATDIGLMMVFLKLNRHAHRPKDDNLVDAHGYLLCVEWIERGRPPINSEVDILRRSECALQQTVRELQQAVEDVSCSTGLLCPICHKRQPCCCEHKHPTLSGSAAAEPQGRPTPPKESL